MQKKRTIFNIIVLSISIILYPIVTQAQEEPPCMSCMDGIDIHYGEHSCECPIDPVNDTDIFNFSGRAGWTVVNVSRTGGPTDFVPRLRIWDSYGTPLSNITGYHAQQWIELPTDGIYVIGVSDNDNYHTGNYVVQLERVSPIDDQWPCMDYNTPAVGTIDPVTDYDIYTFEGSEGTTVEINVSRTGGPTDFVPRLNVWNVDSNAIVDTTGYHVSETRTLTKTGTYVIGVSDNDRLWWSGLSRQKIGFFKVDLLFVIVCLFTPSPFGKDFLVRPLKNGLRECLTIKDLNPSRY